MAEAELSPEEVQQRVAILNRLRELLQAQRDRFKKYLEVLDSQKDLIEHGVADGRADDKVDGTVGPADDLMTHVELEELILADIFSIQKVIDPLEALYNAAYPDGSPNRAATADTPADVPSLKTALQSLKDEAVIRVARNKELLSKRMAETRSELKDLRSNPFAARRSVYNGAEAPSLIDIKL
ncbi:hypothetical protein FACS189444_3240 [Spirochaetia bacterium]|nr:hypothetical protein FACS189444_3240 [Spirochaetia bacterium]